MNYLIRDVIWSLKADPQSGRRLSIRVRDGRVALISDTLSPEPGEFVFDGRGACISPGWLDLMARPGAPGNPQNESYLTFSKAAAAGGFTRVMILPDTRPVLESIESVGFFLGQRPENGIRYLVCAAATTQLQGKKMAEILRLREAGASAFFNSFSPEDAAFQARLLLYMKHGENQLIEIPMDASMSLEGQMHEGYVSDSRGLAGIPSVAEWLMIDRNISLLGYTGGKMHLACLTTPEAVDKVQKARESGLDVTCSIASSHLAFNHHALDQFDTVHKVWPPYREEDDRQGLIENLKAGRVDAVVSLHTPLHYDFKDIEFGHAEFGISNLETSFSTVVTYAGITDAEALVSLFYNGPMKILNMPVPGLGEGMEANFTIFQPNTDWIPEKKNWQSKSLNNPFLGMKMKGLVKAVATENGIFSNPHAASIISD